MERHHFEDELQQLKNRLLHMGALVEDRVHRAIGALVERRTYGMDVAARDQELQGQLAALKTVEERLTELRQRLWLSSTN